MGGLRLVEGCLRTPPGRIPEPGVQVGEINIDIGFI